MNGIIFESTITCPHCGYAEAETMPTEACRYFYDCNGCGALLKPKPGDCCVFCSYGSFKCPPMQQQKSLLHLEYRDYPALFSTEDGDIS